MLLSGVGYREFDSLAKGLFVRVASEEYGLRGRPTNMSRVAAMTGISRKEVSRLREAGDALRWNQANAISPAGLVIHYWHHDPEYCTGSGIPRPLPFQGDLSFSTLVARYAGDIPPGAVRAALCQAGTVEEDANGWLVPRKRLFVASQLDEDLIRHMCFAAATLTNTIVHNVRFRQRGGRPKATNPEGTYLQRTAFTDHIRAEELAGFQAWAKREGARFIEEVDAQLGEIELPRERWTAGNQRVVGMGIYYFQEDREP